MKIAFVVNNAGFFATHRLGIAIEALSRGHIVHLFVGQAGSASVEPWALKKIHDAGVPVTQMGFRSGGMNPVTEISGLVQLLLALRRYRPDIIHSATPKANLYTGLVARLLGNRRMVFAISGLGTLFTSSGKLTHVQRSVRYLYCSLLSVAFANPRKSIIVQNNVDAGFITRLRGVRPSDVTLIAGSGVNLEKFTRGEKKPMVLFPARVLSDKGAREFASSAIVLCQKYPDWRFVIAGPADYDNPKAIPQPEIDQWTAAGIEHLGFVENMAPLFNAASIVCLPSYREGFPKVLMEAAAASAAVVSTDAIGCRDAFVADQTGLQVPVADSGAVERALERLIMDQDLREQMGRVGRALAEERFGEDQIIARIFGLYDALMMR